MSCCVVLIHCCSRLEQCSIAGVHFYDFSNTFDEGSHCLFFLAVPGAQQTLLEVRKQRTPMETQWAFLSSGLRASQGPDHDSFTLLEAASADPVSPTWAVNILGFRQTLFLVFLLLWAQGFCCCLIFVLFLFSLIINSICIHLFFLRES